MKKIFLSIGLMLAVATAFATTQTKTTQDKPWRVYLLSDVQNKTGTTHYKDEVYENAWGNFEADDDDGTSENQTWVNYNHFWLDGIGGVGGEYNNWQNDYWDYQGNHYGSAGGMTGNITWDETGYGEEIGLNNDGTTITGFTNSSTVWGRIGNEHCNVSDPVNQTWDNDYSAWDDDNDRGSQHDTYTRTADTVWHVQTGGKSIPGRQSLWQFSGSASEILDKRAVPQFYGANMREITNKTQISLGSLGNLKADGNLWLTLPDDVEKDITPTVAGKDFFTFSVGGQKYLSHYEVFVRQPYPNYPNDVTWYGPYGPPLGWPVYNLGATDAGHAWWKISTEAPMDIVNQYTSTNCSRWINAEAGYGPRDGEASIDWWSFFLLQGLNKQGPGKVYGGSTGVTVHKTYVIGFQGKGAIDGVNHVENLSNIPGTWDTGYHNCVHEVVITGKTTGVQLPLSDTTPEGFGFNLPPDSN